MKIIITEQNTLLSTHTDNTVISSDYYWMYVDDNFGYALINSTKTHANTQRPGTLIIPVYTPATVKLTLDQIASHVRKYREELLTKCDWTQQPDTQLTTSKVSEWRVYRQKLRDITKELNNPGINGRNIVWPLPPQ